MKKNRADQKIDLWRVFQIAATCSLAITYVFQWGKMISIPSERTGADFIAFYAAGRIAQDYGFSSVYNLDLQRKMEEAVVGFKLAEWQVLSYNHMPYLILFLNLLVNADYIGSFMRWVFIMIGIYVAGSIFFLNSIFPTGKNKVYSVLMMGMLTFFPFFLNSLYLGQDTAILFLGTALWSIGILKKKDWLAATGLALTTIRPHICLTLAIPFFFRYRKVWWRFFLITGILALASILMLGRQGTLDFINLLRLTAGGTWYGMNQPAMLNLIGLMLRTFPFVEPGSIRIIGWTGYVAGIGLVSILWIRAREFDGRLLSLSLIIALLCAPHLHYHDLTLLIIPLIFAATLPVPTVLPEHLAQLPLGISLLLLILKPLHFIMPYILYAALGWWLLKKPNTAGVQGLESR
ncbi:MAG: DUF2029 domain-containing protein [Anaerolineales bacterium]|nr:DUF2029 domain-containing protein [Anaerolineales bacterium]